MATTIGFDTATEETVVGAMVDGEVVFEFRSGPPTGSRPAHSTELLPGIEKAVEAAGGWTRIDRVAVGTGPGTYTGLRVAVATARGLALAGQAEVVGVPTLAALALSIVGLPEGDREDDHAVIPLIDARRGELFFGVWSAAGLELEPAAVGPPAAVAELVSRLELPVRVAGPGALRFRSELISLGLEPAGEDDPANHLRGSAICELADGHGGHQEENSLEPIYLRRPDAERWAARQAPDG